MLTLSIETSAPRGSVAVCDGSRLLAERVQDKPNAHAEQLLPLIDELLGSAGVDRAELLRIAVGLGPGSFTGLRVGIALAQGLAAGLGIEAVGVGSLRTLAAGLPRVPEAELYGSLLDARRNECFFAAFDAQHRCLMEPRVLAKEGLESTLRQLLDGRTCLIAGQAARQLLPSTWMLGDESADHPEARRVAELAELGLSSTELAPLYLRDADAKLPDLPPNPIC